MVVSLEALRIKFPRVDLRIEEWELDWDDPRQYHDFLYQEFRLVALYEEDAWDSLFSYKFNSEQDYTWFVMKWS